MTFNEKKSEVVKLLNGTLNKDSTKEQIDVVKSIEKGIEELEGIHTNLDKEYQGVKDDYIKLIKESGNHSEDGGNTDHSQDKTLDVNDKGAIEKDMKIYLKNLRAQQ